MIDSMVVLIVFCYIVIACLVGAATMDNFANRNLSDSRILVRALFWPIYLVIYVFKGILGELGLVK